MRRMLSVFATVCCLFYSCKQAKDIAPSADFAPYISAYTGGMVYSGSTVVIELTQEQPEDIRQKATDEKLFSFSPAMKGTAHWLNGKMIEFVPEEGEMKSGTLYNASFALGKVVEVEKKFSRFDFSFRVEDHTFKATTKPVEIQLDNTVTVRGELTFSDAMKPDEVKKMLSARLGSNKVDVTVEGQDHTSVFQFAVSGINRTGENQQLIISVEGSPVKIDRRESLSVNIPAKDKFQLFEHEIVSSPEYGLRLTFSDLVSESQDLKGLITLNNVSGYTVQVRANQVMVYFTRTAKMTELQFTVDQGLKNRLGDALGETKDLTVSLEMLKPQVELLATGAIMPDAGSLILPFRAVALHAVDLKIIRIFESNVLMFLQDNRLSQYASNQMRRAGRLVHRQTLRLNTDPTKDVSLWENYSIDLTGLIRQQPGAIYRVELSFKRAYASYECENEEEREEALRGATDLTRMQAAENNSISEEDERYWDAPNAYYYDSYDMYIDWDYYEWSEAEDPCKYTYYMQTQRKAITNVLASNLGLLAKSNAGHTVWAAVTNLLDTKPVPGAKVTAYNYQLQPIGSGFTDGNGFAVLSLGKKPFILVAESGEQKAYLRMVDGEDNMLSRFDVGGVELEKGLKGYIYGERGVWRPGDTLHVAFMMEDREKKIPENHPVSLEIFNPQGQFYKKMISSSGANGLYTFDIPTKADDPTGLWNGYVKVGGATFHKGLRIETIKPNRLKINLDLPDLIDASRKTVPIGIHSQWLTGATARNLEAKMELTLSRVSTQFKGYEKYVFNNPATRFSASQTNLFDGKLNETGDVRFDMKVPSAENAPGMLRATVTCRVFEPGGDASIYSQATPFSPYASYVGINFNRENDRQYLFTDEDHVFDIVTLTPEGKPVSRSDIEYKVYRIGWSWWWEHTDESFDSYLNNSNYTPVYSGKLNTVNGKGQIKFRINYPEWGRYLVFVKDASGGHATGGAVLVDWPSWRGRSNKQDPNGIKMLAFSLDRESYETGEEAVVTIPATAAEGRALVALENGTEVLRREWVTLTAGEDTKYTFGITEKMTPNIYVHISLLQPHAAAGDLPIRMYGVMPVFATNRESVLTPVIAMTDVLKPETEFDVNIREKSGKPMTYTLAIVDDGLLDLTNFKTPDPWSEFYAREALGVRTWDLFDDVMGAYAGKYGSLFTVGGDADLTNSPAKANRFKPVVRYVGPVILGAGEEKKHTLRLPPYVGSVRVMVVAGQNGAYGKADKTVPVRTPLMLLSSLPRVLSTGETVLLPVNVFAMEDQVKNVTVKVETAGKLQASEGNSRSVTFAAPGDEIVYFPMKTGTETGIETVTVTATGGGHTSKETIEIEVRNPNPPHLTFKSRVLEKGESVEFDYELDAVYEGNWVKAEMSRIPAVDISRRFDYLYDYNHYCTEQLTSCAFPQLFISDFKELDGKETERTKKNVTEAIGHLYKRQLSNGGFMYWEGQGSASDWISSYAGSFLILAKERGYSVNGSVISKWISYQREVARSWRSEVYVDRRYSYHQSDLLQAYRLYSLALAGAPEMGAMNRLKELKDLSQQARWRLAAAYALCGKTDAAGELVFNAVTAVVPYSSNNQTYGSSERDEAMILEALVLMDRNQDAFKQAQKVSENLSRERYFSTQSTAYAMIAMGQFASKMSGELHFDWSVNGKAQKKVETKKAIFQTVLPSSPSAGKVSVRHTGSGLLYFSLSTRTRPVTDRLPAVAENLKIDVSYTNLKGDPINVNHLMQGTDFYAVVKVSNISGRNDYSDIALTHIIPSGWEIFNERMIAADTPGNEHVFNYQDIRDDCVMTYFDLPANRYKEIKIRLQASYVGEFVFPAILCEAMYDASARARTTAGRVSVTK
ncbi:MAG: alpha-2-macroglobulin [Tannerella sp.]|nr:alpha-2-macroglobulin [Tannerella sp.]